MPRYPTSIAWLRVASVALLILTAEPAIADDAAKLSRDEARELLQNPRGLIEPDAPLVKAGERAFDAYEQLLADSETDGTVIGHIYLVLTVVKGDRSRFRGFAVGHLGHPYEFAHRAALLILAEIGKQEDCGPIVALIWARNGALSGEAATTLAAIGGRGEMIAIDIWLQTPPHKVNDNGLKHMRECRGRIQARLK